MRLSQLCWPQHSWQGATRQDKTLPTAPATRTTYDASGRVSKVERLDSATLTKVTASGQPPSMTVTAQSAVLTTTRTFYDAVGRVQYSLDARGVVTENQYDAAGHRTNTLVYANSPLNPAATDSINPSSLDPNPLVTSSGYDANGNQIWATDALGHTTTNVYDSANRVVAVQFPATADNGPTSRLTAYDGLGRRVQETNEAGVSTAFAYDFRGLLLQVTLDAASTNALRTTYDYDELGNEVAQTNALGRTTRYDYDALGRRVKRTLPNVDLGYGYDTLGRLQSVNNNTIASPNVTTYSYDAVGNLDQFTYPKTSSPFLPAGTASASQQLAAAAQKHRSPRTCGLLHWRDLCLNSYTALPLARIFHTLIASSAEYGV